MPQHPPEGGWTLALAQAELPRVRELLETLRRLVIVRQNAGPSDAAADAERAAMAALEELDGKEIVLRDVVRGLIDFPIVEADGVVWLACWEDGDGETIGWWHYPSEGFAGRKPLPRTVG